MLEIPTLKYLVSLSYTISKSTCYSRFETRNELRYYEPLGLELVDYELVLVMLTCNVYFDKNSQERW